MNRMIKSIIDWHKIQAVIFDVDGTLYRQRPLRLLMLRELSAYFLMRPDRWKDLIILHKFRSLRKETTTNYNNNINLLKAQFHLTAEKAGVPVERVEACVEKWIMVRPLKYLKSLRYPGLLEFYNDLRKSSIKLAAFSDYPIVEKLRVLDMSEMIPVCSTDSDVNSMKPNTKGLLLVVKKLNVSVDACLFIGDQDERDGECARKIGMPYLIKTNNYNLLNGFKYYEDLNEAFRQFTKYGDICTKK